MVSTLKNTGLPTLTDDYGLWLKFIEKNDSTGYLSGLSIYEITRLILEVQYYKMENVPRDFILTYYFKYIKRNIARDPNLINHFWDVMTDKQKKKYNHFGMKFGFFED
jgi:hypothetical protein